MSKKSYAMEPAALAVILGATTDPCSSQFEAGEIPGWEIDPTGCAHWIETVWCVKAADVAIDQVVNNRSDGAGGAAIESGLLQRLIDDFCGTPPRWPLPWPKKSPLKDDHLSAGTLLMVGSRLQLIAERMRPESEQPELEAAAEKFFDVGFERLAETGAYG